MKVFPFFLIAATLFATVNEPLRSELISGYRNDRLRMHLKPTGDGKTLTYSALYRDLEYWENGLVFKVIHRDLCFSVRGAYGAFGKGTLFQNIPGQPEKHLQTHGWTADGSGYFGYAVNLTTDRTYKVILTPLFGYSAHFERQNPMNMRLSWNGFLMGMGFIIEPGGRLIFNGGYHFHFIHNRFHSSIDEASLQTVRSSSGGNKGHTGWVQADTMIDCFWRFGLGVELHYFFTRVVDATLRAPSPVEQHMKLRWTAISGWAQISREF